MTQYTLHSVTDEGKTIEFTFGGDAYIAWPQVLTEFMLFLTANEFIAIEDNIAIKDEAFSVYPWTGRVFYEEEEKEAAEYGWIDSEEEEQAPW
jgi:hypothetical protein